MHIFPGRAIAAAALITAFALGGCDSNDDDAPTRPQYGSSSSSSSSSSGNVIEGLGNIQVHFPPAVSRTEAETLTVRGIIIETAEVGTLFVGDTEVNATETGTWSIDVPLAPGNNTLRVEQERDGERELISELNIERAPALIQPSAVAVDNANSRVLVLDRVQRTIIAVDLESGARSQLSPADGDENLLDNPRGVMLDAANNRLFVYQAQIVTEEEDSDSDLPVAPPAEEENPETQPDPDPEEPEVEVPDAISEDNVAPFITIDLTTGAQTEFQFTPPEGILLDNSPLAMTMGDGFAYVSDYEGIYFDEDNNRINLEDAGDAAAATLSGIITKMDLSTGAMQVVSNLGTPDRDNLPGYIRAMSTTTDADTLYAISVLQTNGGYASRILSIDKATGKRSILVLDTSIPDSTDTISVSSLATLELDYANQKLFVLSGRRVLQVDLADENQVRVLSATGVPEGSDYRLVRVTDMHFDSLSNSLYLADDSFDSILAVDAATGQRTRVDGVGVDDPDYALQFSNPTCVALAPQSQSALMCEGLMATAFRYDLSNGEMSVLASRRQYDAQDQSSPIRYPLRAVQRGNGADFLVLDNSNQMPSARRTNGAPRLLSINSTGEVEILQIFSDPFVSLRDLVYHPGRDAAYLAIGNSIVEFLLGGEEIEQWRFSDAITPNRDYRFSRLQSLAMDYDNNRILALDLVLDAVIAVDLNTGARSPLSSLTVPADGGPTFEVPQAIVVDADNNRALVLDSALDAIVAVDLTTGVREIVFDGSNSGNKSLYNSKDLALHPFGYALVVDDTLDTLMAIDISTGQVVTLAR